MKSEVLRKVGLVLVGAGSILLQACSGPHEDPRVSFCRGMAADLTGGDMAAWSHAGNRFVEPEYAVVKVQSGSDTVSCWYEYTALEPGAMELATPLLAYSTLPYQVEVEGQLLKGPALTEAVKQRQIKFGQTVIEQVRQGVDNAVKEAGRTLDKLNPQ